MDVVLNNVILLLDVENFAYEVAEILLILLEDFSEGVEVLDCCHEVQLYSLSENGGFLVEVVAILSKQLLGLEVALGRDLADLEAIDCHFFRVFEEFKQEIFSIVDGDVFESEVDLTIGLVGAEIGRDVLGDCFVGVVVELECLLGAFFFGLVVEDVGEGFGPKVVTRLVVSDIFG